MSPVSTEPIWKASTRLADGREIVYFDETPGLDRVLARDTRPLPPAPPGPPGPVGSPEQGIRWDPLAGEWVVIAAARQDRTFLPPADQCPLDPSATGRPTEIPAASYDVVVFENRFPSLREPLGRCEVICFTSDHDSSFARLTPERACTVFEAWVDRGAERAARDQAGVLLGEPGRGDRRHAASPARADLRVWIRHPAHRAHGDAGPRLRSRPHWGQPVRRLARRRTAGAGANRGPQRALDRVRARGRALALRGTDLPRRPGA